VICAELMKKWGKSGFEEHVAEVQNFYKNQRDKMIKAADTHLTGLAEWDSPKAGMFLWMKLNGISDTQGLIEQKARQANVLLVPGKCFSNSDGPSPYVRAAYSLPNEADMNEGFKRLATLIREAQKN
jgi:kynurenine/2-aminoadipate aminotransferase